jgi:lysophospholipase L1-like esterase
MGFLGYNSSGGGAVPNANVLSIESGDGQSADINTATSAALVAKVVDSTNRPVPGVDVVFLPAPAILATTVITTDVDGLADAGVLTMGATDGDNPVKVISFGCQNMVAFTANATPAFVGVATIVAGVDTVRTLTIYLASIATATSYIDWGDGSVLEAVNFTGVNFVTSAFTQAYPHIYALAGTYTVKISNASTNIQSFRIANTQLACSINSLKSLVYLFLQNTGSVVTGSITGKPLKYLYLYATTTYITGLINDMPLVYLSVIQFSGSLGTLSTASRLTFCDVNSLTAPTSQVQFPTSSLVFGTTITTFQVSQGIGLTSAEVDSILVAAATKAFASPKTFNIAGNNAPYTSASNSAVVTLQTTRGVELSVNSQGLTPNINQVYLLGDSLTLSGNTYGNQLRTNLDATWIVNWRGVGGDTTEEMLTRITDVTGPLNAAKVIVWGGVNDIAAGRTAAQIKSTLADIFVAIKNAIPTAKIQMLTVPPFAGNAMSSVATLAVQDDVNTWIKTVPTNVDEVCDAFAILEDPANLLHSLPAYDLGDHLHLSVAGFTAIGNAVYAAGAW